jgi:hypothetical protein
MAATREFVYRQPVYALDDLEGQVRALHEDGFALIPGVLSPEEVAECRDHIDRLKPIHWDRLGAGPTDHFKNVFNQDVFWLPFIDRPGIIELAEATMGADCHIIGETAWRSRPGKGDQKLHADQLAMELPEEFLMSGTFQLPVHICTAHYYLSDITPDLCPTYVIPGSHRSGRRPRPDETTWHGREAEPVLCKAGDVLFFRSEVWHRGSANATQDGVRYLLQVHYGRRGVAQRFSPYLAWQFHPDVLAAATPRQRRLLGDHKQSAYD